MAGLADDGQLRAHPVPRTNTYPQVTDNEYHFTGTTAFTEPYPNGLPTHSLMIAGRDSQGFLRPYGEDYIPDEFYINPPPRHPAVFSTLKNTRPPRHPDDMAHGRCIHLWTEIEITSTCNSIRTVFWDYMKAMQQPLSRDDLWVYFDGHDLYNYGVVNLWEVINQLFHENQVISVGVYEEFIIVIGQWVDEWVTNSRNRDKLIAYNDWQGPILSIFTKDDATSIGQISEDVIPILDGALHICRSKLIFEGAYHRRTPPRLRIEGPHGNQLAKHSDGSPLSSYERAKAKQARAAARVARAYDAIHAHSATSVQNHGESETLTEKAVPVLPDDPPKMASIPEKVDVNCTAESHAPSYSRTPRQAVHPEMDSEPTCNRGSVGMETNSPAQLTTTLTKAVDLHHVSPRVDEWCRTVGSFDRETETQLRQLGLQAGTNQQEEDEPIPSVVEQSVPELSSAQDTDQQDICSKGQVGHEQEIVSATSENGPGKAPDEEISIHATAELRTNISLSLPDAGDYESLASSPGLDCDTQDGEKTKQDKQKKKRRSPRRRRRPNRLSQPRPAETAASK